MKMKSVLTIAGSDPISGAGIQADLKTFSTLGVYGFTAITAITVQNTKTISRIFPLPSYLIAEQIKSIISDSKPNAIKVGMAYNRSTIFQLQKILKDITDIPIIIDPILISSTNTRLLMKDALNDFVKKLLPISNIITPNIAEAEEITKIRIRKEQNLIEALKMIKEMGAKNVIIKSSQLKKDKVIDILLDDENKIYKFSNPKKQIPENHGSGCNFSAALSAFTAKGYRVDQACKFANKFIQQIFEKSVLEIGKGLPVADAGFANYYDSMKYNVLVELSKAVRDFEDIKNVGLFIPETQTNFVYALPDAENIGDVAGVKGRIVKLDTGAKASSCVEFGTSTHVATAVLTYMQIDNSIRSAINLRFNEKFINIGKSFLKIVQYDRTKEPIEIKRKEGSSIRWGIQSCLSQEKEARMIFHQGDIGKEPMIILFADNPQKIIKYIKKIINEY
ncbi:MAG TPA: bifunctional hydroxymethylpyrimidine kinase/phosphomethylpyrimidine kinase [Nitrososphaeraceae archaeon]|nr:bifunctional hydroxymethylpyrimidine kinase/phosphomethylpyrimidine kinase [Nitrososphaeraceae archaeon]